MKLVFAITFLVVAVILQAEPVEPMTGKSVESQVSAIASKFSDVYSASPSKIGDFTIGSSIRERLASHGIEFISLVCIDGFTKIYQIGKAPFGKTKEVIYEGVESAVIRFEDGVSLHAKSYQCSARPITFIIYRKNKS